MLRNNNVHRVIIGYKTKTEAVRKKRNKTRYIRDVWAEQTFILKKVMLVRRSTVDFRSCSRSGLLAGKLFWNTHTHTSVTNTDPTTDIEVSSTRVQWCINDTYSVHGEVYPQGVVQLIQKLHKALFLHNTNTHYWAKACGKSLFCSSRLHVIDQKYSKNCNTVKYYNKFKITVSVRIYSKMSFIYLIKAVFSASLLQSSVSHDLQKS